MATYKSFFTGKEIDDVVALFSEKNLEEVNGIIKRNTDGSYGIANWGDIVGKPTTISGYGITDAYTQTEVDAAIVAAIEDLPKAVIFKGSLGVDGTISTLPEASSLNEGFEYKVITEGTYASQFAKIGDIFISDGNSWILIPSGDEPSGTVTSIATGVGLTGGPVTSSGTIKTNLFSETSIGTIGITDKLYAVGVDSTGALGVLVPWTDGGGTITDVQVDGTSVVSNGVADIDFLPYTTTIPIADNTNGLKIVYCETEPVNKYRGWLYLVKDSTQGTDSAALFVKI